MNFNHLSFKKALLPKGQHCSDDRPFIDFIIDGISLSIHLDHTTAHVTPFGWKNCEKEGLIAANRLITLEKSKLENGLQSAYVCSECGDEGCGAVLFDVVNHGSFVEWSQFIYSDGYNSDTESLETIDVKPFYFKIGNYQKAIGQLKSLICSNNNHL